MQPRQTPESSITGPRKSQNSYFVTFPGDFPPPHLLVEGIEKLLAGRGACEGRALEHRATEAALIAKALGRAVEGHSEAVHQVDDFRAPFDHFLDGRLVLQEVAAVNRVVKMEPLAIALLPGQRIDAVDAAFGADAVRALHRSETQQIDVDAQLSHLHHGRQAGQSAADNHHALLSHISCSVGFSPRG